ncbi:MAG: MFS family permease [Paracoccaceae bacterium]|jgi:MFS family permease
MSPLPTPPVRIPRPQRKWAFLALACVSVVLSLTTWFSATAVMPDLVARWGLGPSAAAWLTNAVQAGFVLGALTSSALGLPDRIAPHWLMAGAAVIAGLATLSLVAEPGIAVAIAARFVTGVALAGVYPSSIKLMASWFQTGRGLALGFLIGALTLGSAAPHLVRGLGGGLDWRLVLTAAGLLSLIAAAMFAVLLREGPYPFAKSAGVNMRQIGEIIRNRPVMRANLGYFGHMWELYAMWGWFMAYSAAAAAQGLDIGNVSLLTFAVIAAGAPGCVLGGILSDRIGRCLTTSLMMTLSGCAALLIGVVFDGPTWLFVTVALIWGLTVVADSAQFSAAVTELSPPGMVGSALALQMGVGFALTIVTIWLAPVLAAMIGWRWVFAALAIGPVVGVWAMLTLRAMPEAAKMAGGKR